MLEAVTGPVASVTIPPAPPCLTIVLSAPDFLAEVVMRDVPRVLRPVGACRICSHVEPLEVTGRCETCDFLAPAAERALQPAQAPRRLRLLRTLF